MDHSLDDGLRLLADWIAELIAEGEEDQRDRIECGLEPSHYVSPQLDLAEARQHLRWVEDLRRRMQAP